MKIFLRKKSGAGHCRAGLVYEALYPRALWEWRCIMGKNKKQQNKPGSTLNREEFGYGYDLSIDDMGVIGQNDAAKKQKPRGNKKEER
ncbi:hypothetical protein SAMN04488126_102108 [Bhargavaea beijingensis]|uniref:Uncharacterized protein n=2 Tax=Bhargavaea beijingensis TaxID=426756 RepID=A0A1G6YWC1_9BACL|nr:hypothetical protein SAMN04488126_102108 [Bhargavaea beijingensis]